MSCIHSGNAENCDKENMGVSLDDVEEDTPLFRRRLMFLQDSTSSLGSRLKRITSLLEHQISLNNQLCDVDRALASEIGDFMTHEVERTAQQQQQQQQQHGDTLSNVALILGRMVSITSQVEQQRVTLIRQMTVVHHGLLSFMETDIANVTVIGRKEFSRLSVLCDRADETFAACHGGDRRAMAEAANCAFEAKRIFHKMACRYVNDMRALQYSKVPLFLERMLELHTFQLQFMKQGHLVCTSSEKDIADGYEIVEQLKSVTNAKCTESTVECMKVIDDAATSRSSRLIEFQMHDLCDNNDDTPSLSAPPTSLLPDVDITKSGFLFIRERRLHITTWVKRYFYIIDGLLMQQQRDHGQPTLLVNLVLCTVKKLSHTEINRNFCLHLISPNSTYILQAKSSQEQAEWRGALIAAIALALDSQKTICISEGLPVPSPRTDRNSMSVLDGMNIDNSVVSSNNRTIVRENSTTIRLHEQLLEARSRPHNNCCADCGDVNPEWASVNIGCFVCMECSGAHRSLGVHISQVRSLTLDRWRQEWLLMLEEGGNTRVNEIYEAAIPHDSIKDKPQTHQSTREEREAWVRRKYVNLEFVSDNDERNKILNSRTVDRTDDDSTNDDRRAIGFSLKKSESGGAIEATLKQFGDRLTSFFGDGGK